MKIITVISDKEDRGFKDFLYSSCQFFGLNLTVLYFSHQYTNPRVKDDVLKPYLEQIDDEEIIFFTDGIDTVFLAKEEEIELKFRAFESPLVFSSEINCWPDENLKKKYAENSYHFKYLNTGGFIGKAGYIKHLYKKYSFSLTDKSPYNWSNQYYWQLIYLKNKRDIKIDHECSIFYNTATNLSENDFRILSLPEQHEALYYAELNRVKNELFFENNRLTSLLTKSLPCHIHFPGPVSKRVMFTLQWEWPWKQNNVLKLTTT